MRRRVDSFLNDSAKAKPPTAKDDALFGLRLPVDLALELFDIWRASQYVALPFPGTLMQQPWYVLHDFRILLRRKSQLEARKKKRQGGAPKQKPPSFDEAFGGGN